MAHGTRGRWVRVATAGFGVMLCTGFIGCLHDDKPKDTKIGANKPLPGTPRLDANGNVIAKNGQPTNPYGNPYTNPYGGSNVQPTGGAQPTPAGAGMGNGMTTTGGQYGQYRSGLNTNNGTVPQQNFGGPSGVPGGGAMMGTPSVPGMYSPPAGGGVTPSGYLGSGAGGHSVIPAGGSSPQPPSLVDVQLTPPGPPPGHVSDFGSGAGTPISPPTGMGLGPVAPIAPSGPPPTGKGSQLTYPSN